jgi:phosphogluconate dehydratase
MAQAGGIVINWDDFDALSEVVPLLARIYPNGTADVNHFHAAGGVAFLTRELIAGGLVHADIPTVMGNGLVDYTREPWLDGGTLAWRPVPEGSGDTQVLRPVSDPFSPSGGLKVLRGNLGRAVIKISAVKPEHQVVEAPARVFDEQNDVLLAFQRGELDRDVIVVVRGQGPRANGMPELHKLTPALTVLQKRGHHVALVTDGRMSGASGAVPAAIHLVPESMACGPISKLRDGDVVRLDGRAGRLEAQVPEAVWAARTSAPLSPHVEREQGWGRELFSSFRARSTDAESGARTSNA